MKINQLITQTLINKQIIKIIIMYSYLMIYFDSPKQYIVCKRMLPIFSYQSLFQIVFVEQNNYC